MSAHFADKSQKHRTSDPQAGTSLHAASMKCSLPKLDRLSPKGQVQFDRIVAARNDKLGLDAQNT